MHFLVFPKIIVFPRGGGDPDVSKGFFYAIDIFVLMYKFDLDTVEEEPPSGSTANSYLFILFYLFDVFLLPKGNLACLTDNCLLGLVRTCLINCNWLFTELSKGDWR